MCFRNKNLNGHNESLLLWIPYFYKFRTSLPLCSPSCSTLHYSCKQQARKRLQYQIPIITVDALFEVFWGFLCHLLPPLLLLLALHSLGCLHLWRKIPPRRVTQLSSEQIDHNRISFGHFPALKHSPSRKSKRDSVKKNSIVSAALQAANAGSGAGGSSSDEQADPSQKYKESSGKIESDGQSREGSFTYSTYCSVHCCDVLNEGLNRLRRVDVQGPCSLGGWNSKDRAPAPISAAAVIEAQVSAAHGSQQSHSSPTARQKKLMMMMMTEASQPSQPHDEESPLSNPKDSMITSLSKGSSLISPSVNTTTNNTDTTTTTAHDKPVPCLEGVDQAYFEPSNLEAMINLPAVLWDRPHGSKMRVPPPSACVVPRGGGDLVGVAAPHSSASSSSSSARTVIHRG